jgi:hypothetical protein
MVDKIQYRYRQIVEYEPHILQITRKRISLINYYKIKNIRKYNKIYANKMKIKRAYNKLLIKSIIGGIYGK